MDKEPYATHLEPLTGKRSVINNTKRLFSVVIPAYNEEQNIVKIYNDVVKNIPSIFDDLEIIVVNDGSYDNTGLFVRELNERDKRVKLVTLSRNFGKEIATSAGLAFAQGDANLVIDADGQHPPKYIKQFVKKWQNGAKVVIGIRESNSKEGLLKKYGSKFFYVIMNRFAGVRMVPNSTDFRLIDKEVREAFSALKEGNRISRGLIDWIGYKVDYVRFDAKPRLYGSAGYSIKKLITLAVNSVISLSLLPLYISGYVGLFITSLSFTGGVFVIIENYLLNDPLGINITGTAQLGILLLFLIGIVLIGQGLTAIYISRIYEESKNRPLFIVDQSRSVY